MDNRRPTGARPEKAYSSSNSSNTSSNNRTGYYKKNGENSFDQKPYQSRDNRFQNRDDRYQPKREDRFSSRDRNDRPAGSRSGDGGSGGSSGRFQPRDNKFQPRGERFQSRDDKFQPRGGSTSSGSNGGAGSRFSRRDDRSENRNDRFQPRKNFNPRGGVAGKPLPPWKRVEKPRIYDEMQITDGKHIGKFLKSTSSPKMRPTARRVREAMFKLIFRRIRAGRVLDLCAGSGAVGIEAISRGALICTFVERSAKMCAYIKKNLENIGIKEGHGEVFEIECVPFLKQMAKRRRFWDVVFFDPPYDTNYDEVLSYLSRGTAIKPGGTLVVEHHAEMFFPEKLGVLQRWRVVILGDTALSFYERK